MKTQSLPVNYRIKKEIAIVLGSLGIILSFLAGYLFGTGNYSCAFLVMAIYIVLDNIGSRVWLWVLENIIKR